jgi:SagB-type dehydrogenase family enzyme
VRRRRRERELRVRRSPHLVIYWRRGVLVAYNYAARSLTALPPRACELLNACDEWTALSDLSARGIVSRTAFAATVDRLVELMLLERSDRPRDARANAMDALTTWNPHVGFFHSATCDVRYTPSRAAAGHFRDKVAQSPPPAPVKRYRNTETIDLAPPPHDAFASILQTRRTWRRYSSQPVTRDELGTILALTAGVQQWIDAYGINIPLKTSPSGGARHSVECYIVIRDVRNLKSGIYHYAADRHALERIGGRVSPSRLRAYVPGSEYFANASAFVFFTAMFERLLWRYNYARAYRAALIECGHVCQTFCLTATKLGLAPFSVMALADSLIEQDLGIDGIKEAVLYAAGVGRPPRGSSWAARPKGPNPPTKQNSRVSAREGRARAR